MGLVHFDSTILLASNEKCANVLFTATDSLIKIHTTSSSFSQFFIHSGNNVFSNNHDESSMWLLAKKLTAVTLFVRGYIQYDVEKCLLIGKNVSLLPEYLNLMSIFYYDASFKSTNHSMRDIRPPQQSLKRQLCSHLPGSRILCHFKSTLLPSTPAAPILRTF